MSRIKILVGAVAVFYGSLFFHFPAAQAVVVDGLYEAEVPMPEQSANSRITGITDALRIVLVKLTGDSGVVSRYGMANLFFDAEQHVQQFEYRSRDSAGQPQSILWVKFNRSSLDDALRLAGVPKWGRERPLTLVWLVAEYPAGRRFVASDDVLAYVEKLNQHARTRGIVLTHPLLDLEDTRNLHVSDVWGSFYEAVFAASARYVSDVVLTGRIGPAAQGLLEARWTVYIGRQVFTLTAQGMADAILMEGIDGLADILAQHYGQAGLLIHADKVEIIVDEISDYDQYAKVLSYFSSLNSVVKVEVEELNPYRVVYLLSTDADASVVLRTIDLGQVIQKTGDGRYRLAQ